MATQKNKKRREENIQEIKKSLKDIASNLRKLDLYDEVVSKELTYLEDEITTKFALQCPCKVKLRIASWNLRNATEKGKYYPEKIEIICKTIKRINPDIIALQEIASPGDILDIIRDTMGKSWRATCSTVTLHKPDEYGGFLWKDRGEQKATVEIEDIGFKKKVCKMEIQIENFWFTILNFHFACREDDDSDSREENDGEVKQLCDIPKSTNFRNTNPILLGDFNICPINNELTKSHHFERFFEPHEYTNVAKSHCYDNIIVHHKLKLCSKTHHIECIDVPDDETKKKLPNMFDHLPIWAEFEIPITFNPISADLQNPIPADLQ